MNFVGHKIGGVTAAILLGVVAFVNQVPLILIGIMMGTCFIFSLFPDTDIKSISSKVIYLLGIAFAAYLWYIGKIPLLIITVVMLLVPQVCKHRGFTHTILGALLFSLTWSFILSHLSVYSPAYFSIMGVDFNQITVAALCGFFTHFILDMHFKII